MLAALIIVSILLVFCIVVLFITIDISSRFAKTAIEMTQKLETMTRRYEELSSVCLEIAKALPVESDPEKATLNIELLGKLKEVFRKVSNNDSMGL